MRAFLAFLLTPIIVCLLSMPVIHMINSGLSLYKTKDASFILLFLIVGPAVFMSFFVYLFEVILFLPVYTYMLRKNYISTLNIIASATFMSLVAGLITSVAVKGVVNIQFILFSTVIGVLSGVVFSFIHGEVNLNKELI